MSTPRPCCASARWENASPQGAPGCTCHGGTVPSTSVTGSSLGGIFWLLRPPCRPWEDARGGSAGCLARGAGGCCMLECRGDAAPGMAQPTGWGWRGIGDRSYHRSKIPAGMAVTHSSARCPSTGASSSHCQAGHGERPVPGHEHFVANALKCPRLLLCPWLPAAPSLLLGVELGRGFLSKGR